MISTLLGIDRETEKAVLASNGIWFPKSQVELSQGRTQIIAMTEWIYSQKFGTIPSNVVRVLSQSETKTFLDPNVNNDHQNLTIGVYEKPDGSLYVVKPTRDTRKDAKPALYAARIVETPSNRVTENGETVTFEFNYERGAIKYIFPEMKISKARAEQLSIRYGKCIVCGRGLKVKESVERGMGPVCAAYFE